jgi:hypothetical protein
LAERTAKADFGTISGHPIGDVAPKKGLLEGHIRVFFKQYGLNQMRSFLEFLVLAEFLAFEDAAPAAPCDFQ